MPICHFEQAEGEARNLRFLRFVRPDKSGLTTVEMTAAQVLNAIGLRDFFI